MGRGPGVDALFTPAPEILLLPCRSGGRCSPGRSLGLRSARIAPCHGGGQGGWMTLPRPSMKSSARLSPSRSSV